MEQARYWMWAKRKHNTTLSTSNDHHHHHHLQVPISNNPSNNDDSWEEQAFAEDAAGPLGGCIWPPRSYSCSFCRREFRSAQALGGHMNVHRRDRARLKQSSPNDHNSETTHQIPHPDHHSVQNPLFSSLGFHQYPSSHHHHHQVCASVYNPNPTTSDHHHPGTTTSTTITSSSPVSPSRVQAQLPCKENCGAEQQTLIRPYSSSPQSRSILATNRYYNEGEKISIINVDSGCRSKGSDHEHVTSRTTESTDHLSVSLNLVVRHCALPSVLGGDNQDEEISCKRRRLMDNNDECPSSSIPFFLKSGSVDRVHHHLQSSEGFELGRPSSIEDLDLELRLGDRPKVK